MIRSHEMQDISRYDPDGIGIFGINNIEIPYLNSVFTLDCKVTIQLLYIKFTQSTTFQYTYILYVTFITLNGQKLFIKSKIFRWFRRYRSCLLFLVISKRKILP